MKTKPVIKPKRKTKAKTGSGLMGEFGTPAPVVTWRDGGDVKPMTLEEFNSAVKHLNEFVTADAPPEREKVYCKGCKYYEKWSGYLLAGMNKPHGWCNHHNNLIHEDTPIEHLANPQFVSVVNANNDCKYYAVETTEYKFKNSSDPTLTVHLTFWQRLKGVFK